MKLEEQHYMILGLLDIKGPTDVFPLSDTIGKKGSLDDIRYLNSHGYINLEQETEETMLILSKTAFLTDLGREVLDD